MAPLRVFSIHSQYPFETQTLPFPSAASFACGRSFFQPSPALSPFPFQSFRGANISRTDCATVSFVNSARSPFNFDVELTQNALCLPYVVLKRSGGHKVQLTQSRWLPSCARKYP